VIEVLFSRRWSLLRYVEAFGRVITTACYKSKTPSQPPLFKTSISYFFPHLLSIHHKSTQPCLHHYLDGMGGWDEQGEDEES
jgi:hypothetical protein